MSPAKKDDDVLKKENWHLDKTVNLPLVLFLAGQLITGTLWFSSVNNRLDNLTSVLAAMNSHENRITKLETKFDFIEEALKRIEQNTSQKTSL